MGEDYRRIEALGVGGWSGCDHSFLGGMAERAEQAVGGYLGTKTGLMPNKHL